WVASGAIHVGGSPQSAGGAGTLSINSGGTLSATGALDVFPTGIVNVAGGLLSASDSKSDGAISISAGSVTLGNLDGTGNTALTGGTLTAKRIRQSSLQITSAARVLLNANGTAAGVTHLSTLS